jgi:hypothetical protein
LEAAVFDWIDGVTGAVVRVSVVLFVAVNAVAVARITATRDRSLVQRWTSPLLAVNLVLLGAGLGTPLLAGMAKFAVRAVASTGEVLLRFVR